MGVRPCEGSTSHPFTDGNGRTARAVMNLELIRAGLPSVIIRRKDRLRYYEALAESDQGVDLGLIAELILTRATDALRDLERAAKAHQGYDLVQARLRKGSRAPGCHLERCGPPSLLAGGRRSRRSLRPGGRRFNPVVRR